jgi:hypothetical protein
VRLFESNQFQCNLRIVESGLHLAVDHRVSWLSATDACLKRKTAIFTASYLIRRSLGLDGSRWTVVVVKAAACS